MVDTAPVPSASTQGPLPDRSVVPPVWSRITNLVVDHGEGSWLTTVDGEASCAALDTKIAARLDAISGR